MESIADVISVVFFFSYVIYMIVEIEDKRFKPKDVPKKIKSLLERGKELEKKDETLLQKVDRKVLDKIDKTMLEIGQEIGNRKTTFKPKKKKVVEEAIEISLGREKEPDDRFERLMHFAKKYHIGLMGYSGKKTYQQLADEVYRYEQSHTQDLIKGGVDKKYHDFGFYIKLL